MRSLRWHCFNTIPLQHATRFCFPPSLWAIGGGRTGGGGGAVVGGSGNNAFFDAWQAWRLRTIRSLWNWVCKLEDTTKKYASNSQSSGFSDENSSASFDITNVYIWFVTFGRPYLRASATATAAHSSKAKSMAGPSKDIALCSLMPRCGDAETSQKKTRPKQRSSHGNMAKQRHFLSISKLFLASANHSFHLVHRLLPAYPSLRAKVLWNQWVIFVYLYYGHAWFADKFWVELYEDTTWCYAVVQHGCTLSIRATCITAAREMSRYTGSWWAQSALGDFQSSTLRWV